MVHDASTVTLRVWAQPLLVWLWDLCTAPFHTPSPPDKSTSSISLAKTETLSQLTKDGEGVTEKKMSRGDKGHEADGLG